MVCSFLIQKDDSLLYKEITFFLSQSNCSERESDVVITPVVDKWIVLEFKKKIDKVKIGFVGNSQRVNSFTHQKHPCRNKKDFSSIYFLFFKTIFGYDNAFFDLIFFHKKQNVLKIFFPYI